MRCPKCGIELKNVPAKLLDGTPVTTIFCHPAGGCTPIDTFLDSRNDPQKEVTTPPTLPPLPPPAADGGGKDGAQ